MQFSELQTEFYAGGWEDWDDGGAGETRAKRLLNEANLALCEEERWPFLFTSATGAAPLTVADLAFVRTVVDTGNKSTLTHLDEDDLRYGVADLSTVGTPLWWYRTSPTVVATYPASTANLRVDYVKTPALLVADADVPVVPTRYHFLIVKGAWLAANLYKDNAGAEAAAVLRGEYDRELARMRSLLVGQAEGDQMRITSDWVG